MKNVKVEVTKDNKLVLTVDLNQNFGISGSGKSVIIGTTSGNVPLSSNQDVKIGLNVYTTDLSKAN